MKREQVQSSLLEAFRGEFAGQMAAVRRDWDAYSPDAQTEMTGLPDLRRELHTIKGSVRLLQLPGLPERVHALEELVMGALKTRTKPERFLDELWDLEEAVASALDDQETDGSEEVFGDSMEMKAVTGRPREASGTSAYELLLALDELLGMGEELAEGLNENEAPSTQVVSASLTLLIERMKAIREGARKMALVPSYELFSGLPELARRVAVENAKQVRVTVRVAPDQLERETVLALRPALIHLVGNAVSHGTPGDSGGLELDYRRRDSFLELSVSDHGGGLNLERLKSAVIGAGHLDEAGWNELTVQERQQWIFFPGLSTRGQADLTAGRGMGLSVVAETAQRLNGTVAVDSGPSGTTFRLEIPAGWQMRSVLRVTSGGQELAVLSSELLAVSDVKSSQGKMRWLGELASVLGYPAVPAKSHYALLWKHDEDESAAVGIDVLGDFDEALVRPLVGFSSLDRAIIGVTPTRGRPVPVISLRALQEEGREVPVYSGGGVAEAAGPLLLVVDDSVTTRTLVSGILTSQGYRVLVARDGLEGLETSRSENVALVVSDYQMPNLDGLEFLEQFRADARTADVPFILLTSIDDVATFEKASALGADRCLGKQNFSQERLIGLVEELL